MGYQSGTGCADVAQRKQGWLTADQAVALGVTCTLQCAGPTPGGCIELRPVRGGRALASGEATALPVSWSLTDSSP